MERTSSHNIHLVANPFYNEDELHVIRQVVTGATQKEIALPDTKQIVRDLTEKTGRLSGRYRDGNIKKAVFVMFRTGLLLQLPKEENAPTHTQDNWHIRYNLVISRPELFTEEQCSLLKDLIIGQAVTEIARETERAEHTLGKYLYGREAFYDQTRLQGLQPYGRGIMGNIALESGIRPANVGEAIHLALCFNMISQEPITNPGKKVNRYGILDN